MKVSIELPVTTRHRRDKTDNVESDVKPEQTNQQTNNSSTFLIQNFQPLTIFCKCTARFVLDLVGTQIVGFLTHMLICFTPDLSTNLI